MGANGSIDITQRSRSVSVIGNQDIILNVGATFNFNGNVVDDVVIKALGSGAFYTAGAATISNTENTYADASSSDLTFTVSVQNRQALTNSADEDSNITLRQYILNIEGNVDNNQELAIEGGESNKVDNKKTSPQEYFETTGYPYVVFPLVTVTGNLEVAASSDFSIALANQLNVSGTLDIAYDEDLANNRGATTVSGTLYVTGTVTGAYYTNGAETGLDAYKSFTLSQTSGERNSERIIVDGGSIALESDISNLYDGFLVPNSSGSRVYGSMYMDEGATSRDPSMIYIVDFDAAVAGAVTAEADDVYVFAFGAQNEYDDENTSETATNRGAFVIEEDISIPDGLTVTVWNALVVGEGATFTVEEGATIVIAQGVRETSQTPGVLWVDGTVVDYDGCLDTYRGTDIGQSDNGIFMYEVMKTTDTDTEYYTTYTSLKLAIADAVAGEEIQLNGSVVISEDLTIPADVTVITDSDATAPVLTVKGATLTINGTLEIADNDANDATVAITSNDAGTRDGAIVVNNVIANADETTFTNGADTPAATPISGAYYNATLGDATTGTDYVTSIAVAGSNSAYVTGNIEIYGTVSMGDVTFTAGENNTSMTVIVKNGAKATAGTVTLVGTGFQMEASAQFTGSVAADVTAGNTVIDFTRAGGMTISFDSSDDGETVTTVMILNGTLVGAANISSGSVEAGNALVVGGYDNNVANILTVGEGATLEVLNGGLVTVNVTAPAADNVLSGLVVDGTIVLDEGTITNSGQVGINGTFNVASGSPSISGVLVIDGTLAVSEEAGNEATLTVSKMSIGADAVIGGKVVLATNPEGTPAVYNSIIMYPGADITGADIAVDDEGNLTPGIVENEYYVNGDLYMTSYSWSGTIVSEIIPSVVKMTGYERIQLTNDATTTSWFTDSTEMTSETALTGDKTVNDFEAAYAVADLSQAYVYVSVPATMTVYIDNVRYGNGSVFALDVGEHIISVQVNPGYTGTASILFDGASVTDSFTITPEMANEYTSDTDYIVISVTGDIAVDTGSTGGDDGMGLTEILLVILVILIVVMAIMVALRLMRS